MASLLASITRRLGFYHYSSSLEYFASVAWVLGLASILAFMLASRVVTSLVLPSIPLVVCVKSCNKPCASFDTARRFDGADCSLASILGRLDHFWSIKMLMLRSLMLAECWLRCWLRCLLRYGGFRVLEGCGLTTTPRRLDTSLRYLCAWSLRYSSLVFVLIPVVALTMRIARWLRSLIAWIVRFGVNQDADAPFDDARCLIDGFDPGGFDCSKAEVLPLLLVA
jgi:hypothetical protein